MDLGRKWKVSEGITEISTEERVIPAHSYNKAELWFKLVHNLYYKEAHNNQGLLI